MNDECNGTGFFVYFLLVVILVCVYEVGNKIDNLQVELRQCTDTGTETDEDPILPRVGP